ncbi:MAG: hypothetical protein Q9174_003457 [Haloplaca sp. 1 TL-2023]
MSDIDALIDAAMAFGDPAKTELIPDTLTPIVHLSTSPDPKICGSGRLSPSPSDALTFKVMYPGWDILAIRKTAKTLRNRMERKGRKYKDVAGGQFEGEMKNLAKKMGTWHVALEGMER